MTFEQYWTILVRQWKFIILCFIVVGLGTYIGSKFLLTPVYQSTVLVQIALSAGNTAFDYNSLLASDELVQTEVQLATSDLVLHEVASHYPGLSVDQLSKEVSSTVRLNTQLFEINVLDPSPTRAAKLANDVAATLIRPQRQAAQQVHNRSLQQIQYELDTTRHQIDAITAKLALLRANGGDVAQSDVLQAQLSGLQQQYSQWQVTLAQFEWTNAQNTDFLRVVQPAQAGLRPVSPNILLNTGAGLALGLSLGVVLALMLEQFDTRVRTLEALSQLLDWPALATIWQARSSKKEDVFHPTGHNSNTEPYRILRTNIGFSGIDKPLHSLMVTSAAPGEGKSVIAANLAIFMARAGKTTLLIDANLRHPTLHELFDLPNDKMGFSNAVLALSMAKVPETPPFMSEMLSTPSVDSSEPGTHYGQQLHSVTLPSADALTATNLSLVPFVHSVGIPNLWVMPSGPLPPNPPELLDSKAMQHLLKVIANCGAEVVIFDTPPLLDLSDVSILAPKVDGMLFVVDITRANKKHLKQAKALLMHAGAHLLGYVVNRQPRSRHDATYSYYCHIGEQNGEGNHHSAEDENIPTTPMHIPKQPEK